MISSFTSARVMAYSQSKANRLGTIFNPISSAGVLIYFLVINLLYSIFLFICTVLGNVYVHVTVIVSLPHCDIWVIAAETFD